MSHFRRKGKLLRDGVVVSEGVALVGDTTLLGVGPWPTAIEGNVTVTNPAAVPPGLYAFVGEGEEAEIEVGPMAGSVAPAAGKVKRRQWPAAGTS